METLRAIEITSVSRTPQAMQSIAAAVCVISRQASETRGTQAVASVTTDGPGLFSVYQGLKLASGDVRLPFKGFNMSSAKTPDGTSGNDSRRAGRIGLRGDWQADDGARWALVGETHRTRAEDRLDFTRYSVVPAQLDIDQTNTGTHLMLRHEQPMPDGGRVDWKFSAEATAMTFQTLFHESRQTYVGEFQRRRPLGRHELAWGASYRYSHDGVDLTSQTILGMGAFSQAHRDRRNASVFVHDDYELGADPLTPGARCAS